MQHTYTVSVASEAGEVAGRAADHIPHRKAFYWRVLHTGCGTACRPIVSCVFVYLCIIYRETIYPIERLSTGEFSIRGVELPADL
jgi:hypothetical protein